MTQDILDAIIRENMNWANILADVVLTLHLSIAVFVVAGLFFVIIGNLCNWCWVNNLWFRIAHIGAIGIVTAEAWLGVMCPLTTLEMWLRTKADAITYGGGFIEHWLQRFLYYDAPSWMFVLGYSLFGLFVVATWRWFPPNLKHRRNKRNAGDGCFHKSAISESNNDDNMNV